MGDNLLSICVIAKNEEKTIPRLVKSLEGHYDQFVLVDTGSRDGTIEVARGLGLEVYKYEWNNSFSQARNYSCSFARGEWIFCPDCDEVVKNPSEFYEFLKKVKPSTNQVALYLHTDWNYAGKPSNIFPAHRCFRRGTHKWVGDLHEYLSPISGVKTITELCRTAWFEHHPENHKDRSWYIDVLRDQANKNPEDPRWLHYMGREALFRGFYVEALSYFERCLRYHQWDTERAQTRIYMADCYIYLNEIEKAEEQLVLSLKEDPTRRDAYFKLGELYREQNKHSRAVVWYRACTAIPKTMSTYFTNEDLYGALPFLRMAYSYWYLGDMKQALEAFNIAKEKEPDMPEIIDNSHYFDFPLVSIIIPTRFKDQNLETCLNLIEADEKSYPNIEVIVVGDESEEPLGVLKATNAGVEKARGDYLVFLGKDCLPQPGWLCNAMRTMKNTFPDGKGMVGFNNQLTTASPQHFLIHREVLSLLPYNTPGAPLKIFNEEYHHNYADSELREVMLYNNKYKWCPSAVVLHSRGNEREDSSGVENISTYSCDEYAEMHDEEDRALFLKRRPLWVRPFTYSAAIMAFRDDTEDSYLEEVLVRVLEVLPPDRILGIMGPPFSPEDDSNFKDEGTQEIFRKYGIRIKWVETLSESERRNEAIKELDTDYVFIIDSDEVWDPEDLKKLMMLSTQNYDIECWVAGVHNYWKTEEYRIDPMESYRVPVLVKKTVKFLECRMHDSSITKDSGLIMHHMNYCRSEEVIKRKLALYNNPHTKTLRPVREGWFDNVWKSWTPEVSDTMEDLHPTLPGEWKKAVKHNHNFEWRVKNK